MEPGKRCWFVASKSEALDYRLHSLLLNNAVPFHSIAHIFAS